MNPYRDLPNNIMPCRMLVRISFPLEEILGISPEEYCSRIGNNIDYYKLFYIIYSSDSRKALDVPKFTEAVVGHKVVAGKYGVYFSCIAMIPKSAFSYW